MKLVQPYRGVQRKEAVTDVFLGFNDTESASEKEFEFTKNMSSDAFPLVCTRKPRELVTTLVAPNGILSFNGSLYTVDGTSFKKDGVAKGTVANSKKCMIEFNEFILIFPDKAFYDTKQGTFGSFATGNPDVSKATVHNNRVFGVSGNQIFASKQGDFKLWNSFQQLNTDSWATDVAGSVTFNTIGTYQNHVVMQSSVNMFELYGYKPSNFQVQEAIKVGSFVFSYVEINSILFLANADGIFAYTGGVPRKISTMIKSKFDSAELGSDGRRLFASVKIGSVYHLFTYDTETNVLYREDNLNVIQFAYHNNKVHALCSDGKMFKFDSGTEVIEWELITPDAKDDLFNKSGLKTVEIHATMAAESVINVFVKADSDPDYRLVKSFNAQTQKSLLIPVILNDFCYKMKLTGRGYVKLSGVKRVVQKGGKL